MNKSALFFFILGFSFLFVFFGNTVPKNVSLNNPIIDVRIGEKTYKLEVVKSKEDLATGLSKFDTIAETQGMLFIFESPGRWDIWMKGMKFNIDIIFLDNKNEVVTLFKNVKSENHENIYQYSRYQADLDSRYVIELKEGEIENSKVKIGDKIEF